MEERPKLEVEKKPEEKAEGVHPQAGPPQAKVEEILKMETADKPQGEEKVAEEESSSPKETEQIPKIEETTSEEKGKEPNT